MFVKVENALRDLWSIFRFAVPGYLGSEAEFRERYEQPISRSPETAGASLERLRRRLRPFLLRRTKRAVASELPEKIEIVRLCELSPAQAVLYTELLKASRKRRIATGAGVPVQEVNRLLNQFEQTQKMMKQFSKGGMAKMMRGMKGMIPGMR